MDARRIIARVRDREPVSDEELRWFARGLADGTVSDAQAGAFAMAVLLNGLSPGARVALTLAMRDSGDVLKWALPGPVVDKHSTGGVGDCVSLVLAPALAAQGAFVPMISGRGLGHTGGTLDKLEAIPGYTADVPVETLRRIVADCGCAIVGASARIAPADRRLYAIRDVTATVESVDLITASILSKKLAAGLEALVLDVKVGRGAFMATMDDARTLARALVDVARGAGCRTIAAITDMDQPLAPAAGNALEVAECMKVLSGRRAGGRLARLTEALGGAALAAAGLVPDREEGAARIQSAVASGAAAERFGRMLTALGGPADFVERWEAYLPRSAVQRPVPAPHPGVVAAIDTRALGLAVVDLGGGRHREGDPIDPSVGLASLAEIGQPVAAGDPLAIVHARDAADADAAAQVVRQAYRIGDAAAVPPLVREWLE